MYHCTACITSRNKEDKNDFNKVSLYRILCIKFSLSQLLIRDNKNVTSLLVQGRTFFTWELHHLLFFFFNYLFIYGCVGSSFLC